jgi:hypothetical protein
MKFNYDAMWALLCRINHADNLKHNLTRLDIIRKRQQIRRYHTFDVGRFLLFSAFHESLALRKRMLSRILKLRGSVKHPPDNIQDFVKELSGPPIRG